MAAGGLGAMNLDQSLKFIEGYAKAYLNYLLMFFGQLKHDPQDSPPPSLTDGKLLIFSTMNAAMGAALQGLFISNVAFPDISFPTIVIIQVCYWIALSVTLYLVLRSSGEDELFSPSVVAIMSVLPVAYVIGAYFGFAAYYVAYALLPKNTDPSVYSICAARTKMIVEVVLTIRYLYPAIREVEGPSLLIKRLGTGIVLMLILFINGIAWANPELSGTPKPGEKPNRIAESTNSAIVKPLKHALPVMLAAILFVGLLTPGVASAQTTPPAPVAGQKCDDGERSPIGVLICKTGRGTRNLAVGTIRVIKDIFTGREASSPPPDVSEPQPSPSPGPDADVDPPTPPTAYRP